VQPANQKPPLAFVQFNGTATIEIEASDLLFWATRIAGQYMGLEKAQSFGRRDAVKGEWLIRVKPDKVIAYSEMAEENRNKVMKITALFIGKPKKQRDARGEWRTAIYRTRTDRPVELSRQGLAGDQVADTKHHGSLDQAVCCYPLEHYETWNREYGLSGTESLLGPGSLGENWTLARATESSVCIGDIYRVGTARVQVSSPRYPCWKQERKTGLPGFLSRVKESLRTGWYLRVLEPGIVQEGDELLLEQRFYEGLTLEEVNICIHRVGAPELARQLSETPELSSNWKRMLELTYQTRKSDAF
jgi:MOSC domain-containing protein YiiM